MSSVLREIPPHFYYLVFFTEEERLASNHQESPPYKKCKPADELQNRFPENLCRFIRKLLKNTHCEYSIRRHGVAEQTEADLCSTIQGEHFHSLLYIKSFVGAEKFIKETLGAQYLGNQKTLKVTNSQVKLFKISYPENCLLTEARLSGNNLFIHGKKLEKILNSKPTPDLGCNFNLIWELQRSCYTPFNDREDSEKLFFLSQRLVELQRSQTVFKDSVLDFIELLERGFGTIHASHHNNVLSVDLGFSDAQCQCIECVEGQNSETDNVEEKVNINYTTDLFTFIDENSQFP